MLKRSLAVLSCAAVALALFACAPAVSPFAGVVPACPVLTDLSAPIHWIGSRNPRDREDSRQWCESVGPVVLRRPPSAPDRAPGGALYVVSWNVAIGGAQVQALVRRLLDDERQAHRPEPDLILLLQETFHTNGAGAPQEQDVLSLSTELGMHLLYVPSMRHRAATPQRPAEDRGNAILSTLPLRDLTAIELPFVRQRRVAVAARVQADESSLTVVSAHLDTRQPFLSGSVLSGGFGRERQATGLVAGLAQMPAADRVIVGGDFNTLGGPNEPAIRVMEQRFARIRCGNPITHEWRYSLDHLFASDPSVMQECRRGEKRYGSDHYPLVARVSRGSGRMFTAFPPSRTRGPEP